MGKQAVTPEIYKERNLLLAEALESGEYSQTSSRLRDETGYCCLGVACDVYRQQAHKGRWTKEQYFKVTGDLCESFPPQQVVDWFGWATSNPSIPVKKELREASVQNDDRGCTFKQIAKGFRWLARQKRVQAKSIGD